MSAIRPQTSTSRAHSNNCAPAPARGAQTTPPGARFGGWLQQRAGAHTLQALAGDAGHRRYFRVRGESGGFVLMEDAQGVGAFVKMRAVLAKAMTVPAIADFDDAQGLCLLEDFGDDWYLSARGKPESAKLYDAAIAALVRLQTLNPPPQVARYGEGKLREEMLLFDEWYCKQHLRETLPPAAQTILNSARDFLVGEMSNHGEVLVHRDYHSRNLMILPDDKRNPGVLDFQDAVVGSPFYDVVSLLRDAYLHFPHTVQRERLQSYCGKARAAGVALPHEFEECRRGFNVAGAQRGLKVLGIFARLALRDGKREFTKSMPLAYRHLLRACRAVPELTPLWSLLKCRPPPR